MEDWILGVTLVLFIIFPCWLALARRKEVKKQVEVWPELAQRIGLTYGPGHLVYGEYRGRLLRQILESEVMGPPWTLISLNVQNSAHFSLCIDSNQIAKISSGNLGIASRFSSMGSPCEYVQTVLDRIVRGYPRLVAWMMHNFCSIKLKEKNLLWSQNGELTDVDDQNALLDLLCDLAELAESMGTNDVKCSEVGPEKNA